MARPPDHLLDHEADGIREYDNPMPRWWIGLFVGTVIWSAIYLPATSSWSTQGRYEEEMTEAAARWPQAIGVGSGIDLAAFINNPAKIAEGKTVFEANCAACHGPDAKGKIGPDLTDPEWIHGGTPQQIQTTVTHGVVEKGMLAWGPVLGEEKIASVVAYVHGLGGGK